MEKAEMLERIKCINGLHKRFMHTSRTQDIVYSFAGVELAHETRVFKRNKLIDRLITITSAGMTELENRWQIVIC